MATQRQTRTRTRTKSRTRRNSKSKSNSNSKSKSRTTTKTSKSRTIGRLARPSSKRVFPTKTKATIVKDGITFHGARLDVDVHNSYRSDLLGWKITIAAERSVKLIEDGIECAVDDFMVRVDLEPRRRRKGQKPRKPPYSAFPAEFRKAELKRFPVLFHHDDAGRLVGLTIFRASARRHR